MSSLDQKEKREKVQELLEKLNSPEEIYGFFEEVGYENSTRDSSYKRDISEFNLKQKAEDKIENIYTVLDYQDEINVLLIETESLSKTHVRYISERLARKFNYVLPIFTTDFRKYQFVLPTFEEATPGEIDIQLTTLEVDSENVFYSDADALSRIWLEEERNFPHVWNKWEKAFSIDKVTEEFFEDYQKQFFHIRDKVLEQIEDVHDAHEFTLQFMNRIMFVYFVDKKGWLEGEEGESYIQWLWNKYRKQGGLQSDENRFYNKWLDDLFHKAFNNKFTSNTGLPEEVNRSFQKAPYLNGGLFRENSLSKLDVELDDSLIEDIIKDFFERYNFTIKEDSPVDKEVAVDPQMIGYVYESLSNVAEQLEDLDKDSRKEFGIFYTPKEEVYFMVRRSLVEYLNNNTDVSKRKIYKLVFAESDEEKDDIRDEISSGEFNTITRTLRQMNAVDPACGSGAFLVGIIDVIAEIYRIAEGKDKRQFDMFETKKKIIQESIYGVDVKDWAVNASELRLFLQLLIETDVDKEKIQQDALLPNLRANLRVGDSLVQDIDGMFFDLRRSQLSVDSKTWMDEIQKEKSYFFDSRSKSKYNNIGDIKGDEIRFFQQVIDDKINELEEKLDDGEAKQQTLNGETREPSGNEKRQITRKKKKTKERIEKLEELKKEVTRTQEKMPLIWEVAFAEVFNTERKEESGFDLLIGNPPYVRQEDIAPPNMDPDEVTKQDKKDYKNKLIESVQNRMPQVEKISKRSDLYIYFYFHGLSLINDEGTFCFITSNSWLDVGYGKELQKFLCKHVPIKGIYNNKNNRSFEHADVNTVISVFGAPNFETKSFDGWEIDTDKWPETDQNAQFVTFKKPYREAVNAENMIALENDTHYDKEIQLDRSSFELYNTGDLRSVQITQGNLLEDGWQYPENYNGNSFEQGKYKGNKWGGKFLKAPDIFFKVLEKGDEEIKQIKNLGDVRRGITTGANRFFYVTDITDEVDIASTEIENGEFESQEEIEDSSLKLVEAEYRGENGVESKNFVIEEEYLKALIKTPRELNSVKVKEEDLNYHAFMCHEEREDLEGTKALDYIEHGEEQEYHQRTTLQSKEPWWDLGNKTWRKNLWPMMHNDRLMAFYNPERFVVDKNLFEIEYEGSREDDFAPCVLSYITILSREIIGRSNLGQGALKTEGMDIDKMYVFDPSKLDEETLESMRETIEEYGRMELPSIFENLNINRDKPIREQEPEPSDFQRKLDEPIFDELGLSEDERKEVYWSVAELVKARLDKAESV
jgi:hypothetical protein